MVRGVLEATGLPAHRLELEITEQMLLDSGEAAAGLGQRPLADGMDEPAFLGDRDEGRGRHVAPHRVQFAGPDLVGMVRGVLEATGLPAHRLELEITEQMHG
jgi:EAL domain-containing protein (putative c-di-GMP-specific phosphodiesterase class I)